MKYFYKLIRFYKENKKFVYLWLAQVITQTSVSIVTIIIGILSHEGVISSSVKESSTSIGIIINLSTIPGIIFAPLAGAFADKIEKKKIMILSNFIRFFLLVFFIIFNGWNKLVLSYFLILSLAIVLQFFIPAEGGLIPRIVEKKYLLFANSLFSLTVFTTTAVGIAFSGLILNLFGIKWTFSICALLFITSAIFVYFIDTEGIKTENNKIRLIYFVKLIPTILDDIKDGINYALRTKILRFILFHLFLIQIVSFTLVTISFRIGNEIYGVSPRTAGLIVFAPVMIGLLTSLATLNIFGRFKNRIKLILIGTLTSTCGFGCIMVIAVLKFFLSNVFIDKIFASISLIIIGFSIPFLLVPAQTLMHENTEDNFRGRILGIWVALTLSLASMVATFVGFLTDQMDNIFIAVLCLTFFDIVYSGVILILLKRRLLC